MLNHKKIPKNNCLIVVLFIIARALIFTGLPVGLSISQYAYAHSLPVTETPAANSIIPKGAALPSKLTIDFSERLSPTVSSIQVLNAKNEVVSNGDFKVIGDGGREAMTTLDTKKLTDGVYTVSWETQSLDDGHIAKGSFVFGIGNVGPGAAASIASGKALQQASTVQAVTSSLDGLVKWPIIVSQTAVVGGIFSHLFLWENFGSKIGRGKRVVVRNGFGYDKVNIPWLRRFFILLVASSIAILAAGSSSLFLEITELSPHKNISSYWSVFVSQISGVSGTQWMMRSITSVIVIASIISFYYVVKSNIPMATDRANIDSRNNNPERLKDKHNSFKTIKTNLVTPLLYIALIAGSISIFSNSITSHNAGVQFLPSLSISLDWLHFMAVSMWIGGLFYISTVLLSTIRSRAATHAVTYTTDKETNTRSPANNPSNTDTDKNRSIFVYYLALLLPRFSILATISLGVIGVSGLYMAWIHLHSLNSLFSSSYGTILIIKLSIALPLVLLGAYHQLRLHKNAVLVASIGKVGRGERRGGVEVDSSSNIGQRPISQSVHNNGNEVSNNDNFKDKVKVKDIPSKFSKTIKIESLIAIGVLLAASLLTITSPPAMNMAMSSMSSSSASMSGMSGMSGMSMTPVKNSTYTIQTKIINVNTKIEINPFYSGFNTFKVIFTDAAGKPYTKVSTTEIVFGNAAADISNVVANLQKIRPGVFSVTGAYISQPGEWDIALSAQRVQDLDLNYQFTAKVTNAPSAPQGSSTGVVSQTTNANNSMQEPPPRFDSFAWIAIVLAAAVVFGSIFYYRRSKQELRKTVEMLKKMNGE